MKRHTGYGWLELIEGILLIILGALAIASPGGILRWITIFYGVMAIVTGITDIIFYAKSERYIGFAPCVSLAAGVISDASVVLPPPDGPTNAIWEPALTESVMPSIAFAFASS